MGNLFTIYKSLIKNSFRKVLKLLILLLIICFSKELVAQCTNTSSYGSAVAPTAGTVTISTCNYQTEYSTISSVVANTLYECSINGGGYVTIRSGAPNGPLVAHGPSPLQWSSAVSGNHYAHWNTNGLCGTATTCKTTTISFISANAPCDAPLPQTEPFSFGILPPDWTSFFTSGDGWRFTGTPGYQAASNGRAAGTYAWIDFSGTDLNTVLETPEWCTGGAPQAELSYDFYADLGANIISPFNILYIEAYDGVSWNIVQINQENTSGWVNKTVIIDSYVNGVGEDVIKVRFRGESGGAGSDFYQDILLDNVNISPYNPCLTPNLLYTLNGTSPICQGSTTNISLSGSQVGVSYQLLRNGTALNAPLAGTGGVLNYGNYSTAGTYSILVFGGTFFCNGPFTLSSTFTLSVSTPPTAPTGITGNSNISCGDQTILSISGGSNGSGATYQWFEGGCGSGSLIGTGPSIAPSPTTTTTYFVRRRGSLPCNVLTACAQVTVNVSTPSPPTVSDEFICPNTSATFTASGAPGGGSYNWFTDAAGTNQVGTGSTYTTPNLLTTTTYYVQSTSAQPTQTYNQTIEISNPSLSASNLYNFLSTPQGAIGTATLSLTAVGDLDGTGTNLEQWSIDNESGQNIGVIGGTGVAGDQCTNTLTNTITLSAADINAWAANGSIEFTAQDLTGLINNTLCGNDFLRLQLVYDYSSGASSCVSSIVGVDAVVLPNPNLNYFILGGGSICSGSSTNISISGSQVGVSYQLLRNGVGTNPPLAGTGGSLSFGVQSSAGTYTVKLFPGSNFCSGNFFLNASTTISIDIPPTAPTSITGINSITCGNSSILTVSGGSDGDGAEFEWFSGLCGNGLSLGSGSTLLVSPAVTTTYFARRKGTSACTSTTSCVSYQVTVNPPAAPATTDDLICINNSGTVTASGAGIGQSYTWYDDAAGTNQVGTSASFTSPILLVPSITYYAQISNSGFYSQTTTVQNFDPVSNILVFNQTPNGPTSNAVLTIYHRGDIDLISEIFDVFDETNNLIGQTLNGTQCNASYTITTFTIPQTNINNFAKDGLIAFELIRDASVSTTLCPNNDMYATLSYSYNSCPSALTPATITVNKPPTDPTGITGNANINCGDQTVLTIDGGLNGSGATYQWYEGACGVGPVIGTGPSIAPSPASTTTYYVRRVGISPCNIVTNCASVTVNVNPTNPPVVSDESVCPGETATFTASGAPTGGTYTWYSDVLGTNFLTSGATFTTPPLTANTTYFVQATSSIQTIAATSAGGNGCGGGVMFDVTTNALNLNIESFDIISNISGAQTVNVYYKLGTHVGSELNAGAWVLLGSYPITSTNGVLLNMPVDILSLNANTTYGIYLNYSAQYTNGSNTYSDSYLTLNAGTGLCGTFASNIVDRTFNGKINYYFCSSSLIPVDAIIEPEPNLSYTISGGGNICTGSSTVISISGSQTNVAYQLLRDGVATNPAVPGTGGSISFGTQTLAGTYTIRVFGGIGYCNGPFVLAGSQTITLDQAPTAPTSISGTSTITCGSPTTLTAIGGSDGSGSTFEWYQDGCGTGPLLSVSNSLTIAPSTTTTYYVRRVGNTSCSNTTTCVSVTVTVNPIAAPTTTGTTICENNTANISATGGGTGQGYIWYDDPSGNSNNIVGSGPSFTTPILSTTTTYYAALQGSINGTVNPLPVGTSFSGNTRGYYFVAPSDFRMTSLNVPDAGTGTQNIAVVKFNNPPTTFPATSNPPDFTILYLTQNNANTGSIPVSISVAAGDIIGILGGRTTSNTVSYSSFPEISIDGVVTPVSRLGMQFNLSTTAPQDLWTETFTSKSRVEFTYETKSCFSNLVPTIINVDQEPTAPTAITGTSTIACGDQTILTATGGSDGSGAIYQWYAGACGGGALLGTGASLTVSPIVSTTYFVRRVGNSTCNNLTTCTSQLITVTPINDPSVTDQTICEGQGATFIATGGPSGASYNWYDDPAGINLVGTGASFTTPNLLSSATYYVQAVAGQNTQTYNQTIQIANPNMLALNTYTFASTPGGAIAASATLTLRAVGDLDGTTTNLEQWSIDDETGLNIGTLGGTGIVGDQCTNTLTNSIPLTAAQIDAWAANGSITFTAEDLTGFIGLTLCGNDFLEMQLVYDYGSGGCVSNLVAANANVLPIPNLTYTVTGGGTFCQGSNSAISISGSQVNVSYQLLLDGTAIGSPISGTGSNITFGLQSQAGTYTVQALSGAGFCSGTFTLSNSATITLDQPATAPTSVSGTTTICLGQSTTLTAQGGSDGSGALFQWYLGSCGAGFLSNANQITVSPTTTTTYYVRRVGTSSCTQTTSCFAVTVVVQPIPTIYTVTGTASICDGQATSISLSGSQVGLNYELFLNGSSTGISIAGTGSSLVFPNISTQGTYTVEADVSSNYCPGSYSMTGSATITVNPVPTVTAGNDTTICDGESIQLIGAASLGGTPAAAPSYPGSCANSSLDTYIGNVTLNGVSTSSTNDAFCTDNTSIIIDQFIGSTYTISVTTADNDGPSYDSGINAYIDWNRDGDFLDANEKIQLTNGAIEPIGTYSNSFTVPVGASEGYTMMRVLATEGTGDPASTIAYSYGETEDYTINILPQLSFSWSPSTGLSATNISNPIASPSSTITYTLTASLNGCSASDDVVVTVNPSPDPVTVGGGGTFCSNSASIFANGGAGGTIYFQGTTSGDTSTANLSSSEIVNSSGTYYFRAYNGNCWGEEDSAVVVLNQPAMVDVTVVSSPNPVFCGVAASPITYTASAINGGTSPLYEWYLNGVLVQTGSSATYTVNSPQNMDDVYVVLNSSLSCTDVNPKTSNSTMTIIGTTPLNDECATAVPVPLGVNFMGTTACATASVEAVCSNFFGTGTADDDVWFTFVASAEVMDVHVLPFGTFDPKFIVYDGLCGSLTELACVDVGANGVEEYYALNNLTVGNSYTVRVYSYGASSQQQGSFYLNINEGCSNLQNYVVSNNGPVCEGNNLELFSSAIDPSIIVPYIGNPVAIGDLTGNGGNTTPGIGFMNLKVDNSSVAASDLDNIKFNINHTFVGDLIIYLVAPDGSSIIVVNRRGGGGVNFTNTILSASGSTNISSITSADAPFTNSYIPENPFSALTGNADGNWTLYATDNAGGDVGSLIDFTLTFTNGANVAWTGPNSFSSSQQNPIVSNASGLANGDYSLIVSYPNGCINEFTTTAVVKLIPDPIITGGDTICQDGPGQPVVITNPTAFDMEVTYEINGVTNTIVVLANSSFTITQSSTVIGNFVYTLVSAQYVNAPTCVANLSTSVVVVVEACCTEPTVAGTIAANQNICIGADPGILTSISVASGQTGILAYQWQQSTDGGTTWTDIPGATATTYDPPVLAQSTLFRRLASVECTADFSNAVISNTITIIVDDNIDPTITCPSNVNASSSDNGSGDCSTTVTLGTPITSDNCTVASVIAQVAGITIDPSTYTFPVGTTTVTWVVADNNGNTASCDQLVSVIDDESPVITNCPLGQQVDNDPGECGAIVTFATPTFTDNCAATIVQTSGLSSGSLFPVGLTTVVFTVTDGEGNLATCTIPIVVDDVELPIINCLSDTTLSSASDSCGVTFVYPNATVIDNCSGASIQQTTGIPSGGFFPVGTSAVTWQAQDTSGNLVQCTFLVTVIDDIPPTFSFCPSDISQEVGAGSCTGVVTWQSPAFSDNCSGSSINQIQGIANGGTFPIGTTTNVYVITDVAGNTDTCTFDVTLTDLIAPSIVCPGDVLVVNEFPDCGPQVVNYSLPTSSDNCGSVSSTQISGLASGSTFPVGVTTNVYVATDNYGNSDTCTFTITVSDPPTPLQPNAITGTTVVCNGDNALYSVPIPTGATSIVWSVTGGTIVNTPSSTSVSINWPSAGTGTISVYGTNGCYDGPIRTLNVQVDQTPSTANAGSDQIVCTPLLTTTLSANTPSFGTGTWTLISGSGTIANPNNPVTQVSNLGNGNNIFRWTISNGVCPSNADEVTIGLDNSPPTVVCQNLSLYLPPSGSITISATDIDNGTTDDCYVANLSISQSTFTCADVGNNLVILTATDSLGNADTCQALVTIIDTVAPVAVCQNITVSLNSNGTYTLTASEIDGGSSDNCSINQLQININSFDCSNIGTNTVSLTVTDVNGNSSTCDAIVTVVDNASPQAVCNNLNVGLNPNGVVTINAASLATASTDPCGIASITANQTTFTCADIGPNVITVTVIDNNGNQTTCSSIVTVSDVTAPNAECKNISIQLDTNGQAVISGLDIDNGSNDSCGISQYVANPAFFDCSDVGPNNVTLTVTDANGNSSSCTAVVTVVDNTIPVVVCTDTTIYLDANGLALISPAVIDGGSTDACGTPTLTMSPNITTLDSTNIGTNLFTLFASDGAGNIDSCTATVTVLDTFAPTALCVASIDIFLDSSGQALLQPAAIDNGSFDYGGAVSLSISQTTFDCSDIDTNIVTLTVTDNTNNSDSCTTAVVVIDAIAPVAICQSVSIQLDANGLATLSASQLNNNSFDNCTILNYTLTENNFDCSHLGPNNIGMTVKDIHGNSSLCTAVVTVEDLIAPLITCPTAISVETNIACTFAGAIGQALVVENCSIDSLFNNAPANFDLDTTNVLWTVKDNSGNMATCMQEVVVRDTSSPQMTCPADFYVQPNFGCSYLGAIGYPANINDNCSIASLVNNAPFVYPSGTSVITWTLTDNSGNTQACNQIVEVQDFVAPTISCAADAIVYVNSGCTYVGAIPGPSASDNCGNATLSNDAPTNFNVGTTTVTWTATDDVGNTAICQQQIIVLDATAPVVNCLGNQSINLDANCLAIMPDYTSQINASDNCGPVSMIQVPVAGTSLSGAGSLAVVIIVSDQYGNKTNCNFNLIKNDLIAPSITCISNQTLYLDASCSVLVPDYTNFVLKSDNCGQLTLNQVPAAGSTISSATTTTVTITAIDASSNTANCSFQLNTIDVYPPSISCAADTIVDAICLPVVLSLTPPTAIDACSGPVTVSNNLQNNFTFKRGVSTVIWTATDAQGNSSTCQQLITVRSPEIQLVGNSTNIPDNSNRTSFSNHTFFGRTSICNSSILRVFEIKNVGNAPLNLLQNPVVFISGTASSDFSIIQQPSSNTIAPGQSETIHILFDPSSLGNRQARVWIQNDDCDESNFNFAIRGQGRKCPPQARPSVDVDQLIGWKDSTQVQVLSEELIDFETDLNALNMKVYPSPNSGQFNIRFNQALPKGSSLLLYNHLGQIINRIEEPKQYQSIAIYEMPSGLYYIRFNVGDFVLTRKVIIKR